MNLICSIVHDCQLLPYFLTYYANCGVKKFIFGIWNGRDNPLRAHVHQQISNYKWIAVQSFCRQFNAEVDSDSHNLLRLEHIPPDAWYAICDLDFFFQAEDGIRDLTVTGVQTCALPI